LNSGAFAYSCRSSTPSCAVIVFAILLNAHCRYEYGIRRLLGAKRGEARGIYGAVFACAAIPGGTVAVLGGWLAAVHLMQKALDSDKSLPLPTHNRWNPAGDQNFLRVMVGFGCKLSDVTVE
jgi:hypothetical protein